MTDNRNGELLIGVARRDITPPIGIVMSGYKARRATGIADRLEAQALVCRGAGGAWLLIETDTIGFTSDLSRPIRQAIAAATGLSLNAIILAGSHTHSGPCTITFGRGEDLTELDRGYLKQLGKGLVELAVEAHENAVQGLFEAAQTEAPLLAHNRRVRLPIRQAQGGPDGSWGNEWEDLDGQHEGYCDSTVLLVAVRRPAGRREALIVNYGCHPVVLGPQSLELSGDYVGYMRRRLQSEAGIGTVLFALAACGNVNPRRCIRVGAEHPRAMGEELARIVLDALPKLSPLEPGPVLSHREPWSITRTRESYKRIGLRGQRIGDVIETELIAARAGELGLIAIPGEPFSEFNARIRAASTTSQTLIVTLANDYPGYFPTDQAQEEGAYELHMAPVEGLEQPMMQRIASAFSCIATDAHR